MSKKTDGFFTLKCGMEFTANAKNNVYLIWDKNTLYFSFRNKPRKVVIDRHEFDRIFIVARQLYTEIINNPASQTNSNITKPDDAYPQDFYKVFYIGVRHTENIIWE